MISPTGKSHQLPSSMVAKEFGEVNVRRTPGYVEVQFTMSVKLEGEAAEGWQTGVALDASASMRNWFGKVLGGKVPPQVLADYERRGWVAEKIQDGRTIKTMQPIAQEDALKRGLVKWSENVVQPLAREFIAYLAGQLDEDGGTTVVYWACGDGSAYEVLGDFTAEQCRDLDLTGPKKQGFGGGTRVLPAMRYFIDRFKDAKRGMYLFLTDGKLDDLEQVKKFTTALAKAIEAGKRNYVKCVLIGVGEQIDEAQMSELDDLDTGTEVDIWDHKIAKEMRDLKDIFAEVVDENMIVARSGRIFDANGKLVKQFPRGLPGKVTFRMPAESMAFELEVDGRRVRQSVDMRNFKPQASGWYSTVSAGRSKPAPARPARTTGPANTGGRTISTSSRAARTATRRVQAPAQPGKPAQVAQGRPTSVTQEIIAQIERAMRDFAGGGGP